MGWQLEWKALSKRIHGLLEAGKFYFATGLGGGDPVQAAQRALLPNSQEVFNLLQDFLNRHRHALPAEAISSLERFVTESRVHFSAQADKHTNPVGAVQLRLTELAAFQAEFEYHLGDFETAMRRRSERAFLHLQRSIVADPEVALRWRKAYASGETACEKLGAAHLLLHGLWAFKANAEGERTDLIMGDRLVDLSEAEASSDALILTEWKLARSHETPESSANQAYRQASRYARGSLAGFELASYRYLVLVSEDQLKKIPDRHDEGSCYRHINIAVKPRVPSKS